jgi:hypothetical protein
MRHFTKPIIVPHIAGPVVENLLAIPRQAVTAETDLPTPNSASFDSQQSIVAAVTLISWPRPIRREGATTCTFLKKIYEPENHVP